MAFDTPLTTSLVLTHRRPIDFGSSTTPRSKRAAFRRFIAALEMAANGSMAADDAVLYPNATGPQAPAVAVWQLASGSGTVGITLGGVPITVAFTTSDINTASLLQTAVNSSVNALVQNMVLAGSTQRASLAFSGVTAGTTFELGGFRFVATAAATGRLGEFSIAGTDTQDAAAAAVAINGMPILNRRFYAFNEGTVLRIMPLSLLTPSSADGPNIVSGSGLTLTAFAASAYLPVYSTLPLALANHITVAASGTGATITNSITRFAGGVGGNVARIIATPGDKGADSNP